jgi:hypothetical protein
MHPLIQFLHSSDILNSIRAPVGSKAEEQLRRRSTHQLVPNQQAWGITHDRSSSSGEPLDLAILDEELGEVLEVSNQIPSSLFIDTPNLRSVFRIEWRKRE